MRLFSAPTWSASADSWATTNRTPYPSSSKGHRGELIDPEIAGHHGRIVNTAGDSVRMKAILISGYAEDVFRGSLESADDVRFLPKPFSLNELAGGVKAVLEEPPRG